MDDPNELLLTQKVEIESNLRMARVRIHTALLDMGEYEGTKAVSDLDRAIDCLRKASDWLSKINTTGDNTNG